MKRGIVVTPPHECQGTCGGLSTRWDCDTLVVESVGFNDVAWLGWEGYCHTDKMTVERCCREGDLLFSSFP